VSALLSCRGLTKSFRWKGRFGRHRRLLAVDRVDLDVRRGECLAIVGESGSGKTTLGRCLIRLLEPDSGEVIFDGTDLLGLSARELRRRRKDLQMVFQDSGSAFDPRHSVADILAEPLAIHGRGDPAARSRRVADLAEKVGLGESALERYAHQLSGGQRQRLGIARALAVEPRLMVLDEPVAALDVSVQARILHLLAKLRDELGLAMIFISHDLAVVRQMAERVAVLYLGRLAELAPREELFERPRHPYTVSLLEAVPVVGSALRAAPGRIFAGEIPSPLEPPSGCRFHPRCPIATARCRTEEPELRTLGSGTAVACHHPGELGRPEAEEHLGRGSVG
jgi:oligopeptide/dipeptide ABC transporter ATP-binding protein